MEMQDTYVRLDRSIASLLELIERKVGLNNVLFCITSTGYADPEAADPGVYRIPLNVPFEATPPAIAILVIP